jgi:20S proteasome subunit alpha 2
MGPDARVLVGKARKIAQRYMLTYGEPIPTNQLVRELASVMQEFTQSGGVRPFGVSLLIIGTDDKGPMLYQVPATLHLHDCNIHLSAHHAG